MRKLFGKRKNAAARARGADESFVVRTLKASPLMLLIVVLTLTSNKWGSLHEVETLAIDAHLRLSEPPERSRVAIVNIDDADFNSIFRGKRPLDPSKLYELIDAVAKARPAVIGVDVDTSDPQFKSFKPSPQWPPVVWARPVLFEEGSEDRLLILDVLGGQDPALNEHSGLPLLLEDKKVTRRYRRLIEVEGETYPSFPWAVVRRARGAREGESTDAFYIAYAGNKAGPHRYKIPASHVLELSKSEDWLKAGLLRDKVVLVGGSYLNSDQHDTPLGVMSGVEVMATVVETELYDRAVKPPGLLTKAVLQILDGIVLIWMFHNFGVLKSVLASAVAVPGLAYFCSYLAFGSSVGWAFFMPILLGVLLHQVYEQAKDRIKEFIGGLFGKKKGAGGSG